MTRQTKLDTDTDSIGPPVSRRNLLRASGAAAGIGVGGIGSQVYAVDEAEAIAATTAIGIGVVGGLAAGYLINEGVDAVTGDDYNKDDYQDANAEETRIGIYQNALTAYQTDETVLTTIENQVGNSENVAWSKGKIAGIDEFDKGNSKTTAKNKAKAAIDDYYTIIQKNLNNHYTNQVLKLGSWISQVDNTTNLSRGDVFNGGGTDTNGWTIGGLTTGTDSLTLLNGESVTITGFGGPDLNNRRVHVNRTGQYADGSLKVPPPTSVDSSVIVKPVHWGGETSHRFKDLWTSITGKASTMKTNIDAYLDSIYNNYNPGEVDTSQFQDPLTVAGELGTKEETTGSYAYAGAEISMLGLEATFDQLMQIYLVEDDVTVPGQLYFEGGPDGGLNVGELYSPAEFTGPIYIGYESSDGKSQFGELEQSFRIESAEDTDGNSVDTVTSDQYNQQTSDATLTEEQLNSITQALADANAKQEAAAQGDSGSGSGSLLGSLSGGNEQLLIYGAAGVALLYLFGGD